MERISVSRVKNLPQEIIELSNKLPYPISDLEPEYTILYSTTNVILENFKLPKNTSLFINGDLTISGLFDNRPFGSDAQNIQHVVVSGDIRAQRIFLSCSMFVSGSVIVEDFIAESGGDYECIVNGNFQAKRAIALGHHMKISGNQDTQFAIGYLGLNSDVPKTKMTSVFIENLTNKWGGVEIEKVAQNILNENAIFME